MRGRVYKVKNFGTIQQNGHFDRFKFLKAAEFLGDNLGEESEWKKFLVSEEVRELMKEIEEKAENPETQLEALELIQANIDKLPMKAFWLAKGLMEVDNPEVKERAKQVVDEYMKRFPQFEEFERGLEALRASLQSLEQVRKIITNQNKLLAAMSGQLKIHEVIKPYTEWSRRLNEALKKLTIPEFPKIEIPAPPEAIVLRKIVEVEQKLDDLKKDIEELKESKQIEKEEYEKLKRKLKELEEELDKAYQ